MKQTVRMLSVCILLFMLAGMFTVPVHAAAYSYDTITRFADDVIRWRKEKNGAAGGVLFTEAYAQNAGNGCDWYAVACGRYGVTDSPKAYLKHIERYITQKYKTAGKLDANKATEWHRIALAVLACGGDPTKIGKDKNGAPVNLIADGVYNRGYTVPLAKQGLNGYAWGLIALDAQNYQTPQNSCDTRDDIIKGLLQAQLADGGFAPAGIRCDPDTTAAVLTALSPYRFDSTSYTYVQKSKKTQVTKTAGQVIEEALGALSGVQQSSGGFITYGEETCESAAQVTIALCALGIDPQSDTRFIKNGNTATDALFSYRRADGGFAHTAAGQSNSIASEQSLTALVSLYRLYNGMENLYNYTDGIIMKTKTPAGQGVSSNTESHSSAQQGGQGTVSSGQNHTQQQEQPAAQNSGNTAAPRQNTAGSSTQATEKASQAPTQAQTNPVSSKAVNDSTANALAAPAGSAESKAEGTNTQQNTKEEGGINPLFFVVIGVALIAGGVGFNAARVRRQKQDGEKDDFFESIAAERQKQNSTDQTQDEEKP